MSTCSVLCKILFCHEANPLFTCYLHACSSNTNFTIFDDWRKFWAINQSFNNKFRKLYYPTLVSVWCLAGEEKTRFAWDWGRDWSSESTKKECYENRFFGIRDLWPGLGISKQHGGKIPDRKYAREAGAENTPPSQTKKNTIVRYQRFWKLSNWGEKNSQEKGPMATTASPTCAIFKVKILL